MNGERWCKGISFRKEISFDSVELHWGRSFST
jgi:hypothetical protein